MRRLSLVAGLLVLISGVLAPSTGYAQQSLNLLIGGFVPDSEDARSRSGGRSDDVLVNNLNFLAFDLGRFKGLTYGAEYLVGIGDWLEGGLGVSLYTQSVPSVYADYVKDNGADINQDLRLRMVPFTATVRFLPLGRGGVIEPYVGAGAAIINWRYSESGEFIDFSDGSTFRESYVAKGTSTGPTILGGLRIPVGTGGFGFEARWQNAEGDLPRDLEFSGDKIDLGGWNYLATIRVGF
ncbi:MAG: hypothetical protein AB7Q29_11780 [Vicinamibacterales bacterium]